MAEVYFKESQKIHVGWKWLFFIALYTLMFWALFEQVTGEKHIEAILAISFSLIILVIFNSIIAIMKLETELNSEYLSYRYRPFQRKPHRIYWSEVADAYLRYYKSFGQFGGHGMQRRIGTGGVFKIAGEEGLQLVLKNGKNLFIGSQKPKELLMIIEKLIN